MNSPSEMNAIGGSDSMNVFRVSETKVAPFEFRMLNDDDAVAILRSAEDQSTGFATNRSGRGDSRGRSASKHYDTAEREALLHSATEAARQEGFQDGEREGLRALRAELDAELDTRIMRERQLVGSALDQFRGTRERYFAEVEQEVVKLSLAIAARVLHREAQLDPLLLAGVVRVALEKMADRSGVVLRVASEDVEAWERALLAMQPHERPRVAVDARIERGECVLETSMGTIELGVSVQLEEIEKGFFDLLSHRPTE